MSKDLVQAKAMRWRDPATLRRPPRPARRGDRPYLAAQGPRRRADAAGLRHLGRRPVARRLGGLRPGRLRKVFDGVRATLGTPARAPPVSRGRRPGDLLPRVRRRGIGAGLRRADGSPASANETASGQVSLRGGRRPRTRSRGERAARYPRPLAGRRPPGRRPLGVQEGAAGRRPERVRDASNTVCGAAQGEGLPVGARPGRRPRCRRPAASAPRRGPAPRGRDGRLGEQGEEGAERRRSASASPSPGQVLSTSPLDGVDGEPSTRAA